MNRETPWDDIRTPTSDYTVRLVAGGGAIPVYWGRDISGRCLLIIELHGEHGEQFRKDGTTVHGIGVDLRAGEAAGQQRLVLTLQKQVDRDLFFGLCQTLIASLAPVGDPHVAMSVALSHLKRWKAFWAARNSGVLSDEEVRGLFAELQTLRRLYAGRLTQAAAVEAWYGPDRSHQDFIFEDTAVEVKSLSGRERNTVRISSEDQLEGLSTDLFLLIHRLAELPDSEEALSLNGLIQQIETELTDGASLERLSAKLAAFGYAPLVEYDEPRFVVTASNAYRVGTTFPRLIRSLLPEGIVRLAYDIKLEAIAPFECGQDQIFGRP